MKRRLSESSVRPAAVAGGARRTVDVSDLADLDARLRTFIRRALDARSSLDAAKALGLEPLQRWDELQPSRTPCWRQMDCEKTSCLLHGKASMRCWLLMGTLCGGRIQGQCASSLGSCYRCPVLRDALADPMRSVEENVLILAHATQALSTKLRTMATRDPLTGLRNRRYLDDLLPAQVAAAERRGTQLWILSLDLDDFKHINDDFGHVEGDAALVAAGSLVEGAVRTSDLVFRMGGDEMLVLLLDASEEQTAAVVARIRNAFSVWNRSEARRRGYQLHCSIGTAALDCRSGIKASIALADQRMYEQKRSKKRSGACCRPRR